MKLTLCFIVLCFVSVSYQQHQYLNPNNYYYPRLPYFYYPNAGQPFNNYFESSLPQAKGIFQSFLPTLTVYKTSIVTSTAAVAQFKSCISSTQFATVGAVTSTAACSAARRRRDTEIAVSPILPSEASVPPVLPSGLSSDFPQSSAVDISSSIWTPMEQEYRQPQARFFAASTITLYSTTVAYSTTTVTQRFNLANAASLLCLPPGFSVC